MTTAVDDLDLGEAYATAPPVTLTPRQQAILRGAADGLQNAEIAARLYVGVDTVKALMTQTYRRLGAHNRAHAVLLAMRAGLIP